MARKKVPTVARLASWDDVDEAMREIAVAQGRVREIEAEMNRCINQAKDAAAETGKPILERISEREFQIRDFVTAHRGELKGKTRKLTFGSTGFRLSTKVLVPTKMTGEIIRRCREYGMDDCIAVKETVLKDVMRQRYTAWEINRTGAAIHVTDEFWYEINEETLTE